MAGIECVRLGLIEEIEWSIIIDTGFSWQKYITLTVLERKILCQYLQQDLPELKKIEGTEDNDDDIGKLLAQREADGKAGAVR